MVLLEPKDLDGFAEKIIYLLKKPGEARQMGKCGHENVRKKFLITRLLSDYLDILNKLL